MEQFVNVLIEQGGWAVFGGIALFLVQQVWKQRCEDRGEMIKELQTRNDKLMDVVERLASALGKNTEVIDRNTQAFERHTEAFQQLKVTLSKVNGKP